MTRTPEQLMRGRACPLRLVIFDCDGVIVDSEAIANRITAASLVAEGWPMTSQEAENFFLGMTLTDMVPMIEAHIGRPLSPGWKPNLMRALLEALSRDAVPIPGAIEAMRAATAMGVPWRIASNSSHEEMRAKFARLGISDMVAGRVHSHRDVARGKPAPDLFLATAAAEGVAPAECVVIEDSVPGTRAAAASGVDCLAYAPHGRDTALVAEGAVPFRSMLELPALFALGVGISP